MRFDLLAKCRTSRRRSKGLLSFSWRQFLIPAFVLACIAFPARVAAQGIECYRGPPYWWCPGDPPIGSRRSAGAGSSVGSGARAMAQKEFAEGMRAFRRGEWAYAIGAFERGLQLDPSNQTYRYLNAIAVKRANEQIRAYQAAKRQKRQFRSRREVSVTTSCSGGAIRKGAKCACPSQMFWDSRRHECTARRSGPKPPHSQFTSRKIPSVVESKGAIGASHNQKLAAMLREGHALLNANDLLGAKKKYANIITLDGALLSNAVAGFRNRIAETQAELAAALRRRGDLKGALANLREAAAFDSSNLKIHALLSDIEATISQQGGSTTSRLESRVPRPGAPTWSGSIAASEAKPGIEIDSKQLHRLDDAFRATRKDIVSPWIMDKAADQTKDIAKRAIMIVLVIPDAMQSAILEQVKDFENYKEMSRSLNHDIKTNMFEWNTLNSNTIECLIRKMDCKSLVRDADSLERGLVRTAVAPIRNWFVSTSLGAVADYATHKLRIDLDDEKQVLSESLIDLGVGLVTREPKESTR